MDEANLAEQGAVPLSPMPPPETSQRELLSSSPTVPSVSEERISGKAPVHSLDNQENINTPTNRSATPSLQPRAEKLYGWPSIAIKQSRPYNTGILRKFDVLNRRVLVDGHTKLWAYERMLHEKDKEDALTNPNGLTTLPFDPVHLIHTDRLDAHHHFHNNLAQQAPQSNSDLSERSDEPASAESSQQPSDQASQQASGTSTPYSCPQYTKDQIMEAATNRMIKHYLLMFLSSHVENLPRVSHYSYLNFKKFVAKDILDDEAWHALLDEENDFVTTRQGLVHENFEWLMHGKPRFGLDVSSARTPLVLAHILSTNCHQGTDRVWQKIFMALQKVFVMVFDQKRSDTEFDDKNKFISAKKLEIFSKIIIGLFCMGMLAGPVGILLLVPLSDMQSFGIVLGFSSVVVVGLSGLDSFYATLVAFSTYTAVLVTSLSNLYQARSH